MAIKYRILKLYPEEHSVLVRYYSDEVTEHDLRTDPADENDPPLQCRTDHYYNIKDVEMDEESLHLMLSRYAPVDFFKVHAQILNPHVDTTMARFEKLKNVDREITLQPQDKTLENPEELEELLKQIKEQN